jgi:Alpha/beta hydrolase domain
MNMGTRALVIGAWSAWTAFSPSSAPAEVTRVEIATTAPWLDGQVLGKAGSYEKVQGRIYFEVDPRSATGRRVTDIALAPRNSKGRVEFSSDFVLVRPRDPLRARRAVLLEIPNRGLTQADGSLFSAGKGSAFDLMNLDATTLSDAFLFEQGFTVAWLGWQFDLPKGAIRMEAPAANVNGLVRQSAIATSTGIHLWRLGGASDYCAADAAQPDAQLLVKSHFDDPGRALPRAGWAFAHIEDGKVVPDPCAVVLQDEFETGLFYELIYRGVHPRLAGLGEAAVSDFVSWLKFGGVASSVRDHPATLSRVLGYGYSQSARFLRDFLYRGFNADERGRQAFDGLFIASAGSGRGSFDHRYAMPGEAGNSVLSDLRPVDLFPFTDGIETDPVTGVRDGLLRRAESSHTVPKIFYTYSSTEYWARVGSLAYTTVDGTQELPLSTRARLYFYAGTPHSHYPFPPIKSTRTTAFKNYGNFASADWSFRALLLDLDAWVAKGTTPPDSSYPHLGADLVNRERVEFPKVPGVEFPPYMPRNWRADYGPYFFSKGIIANEPPKLGQPYTILVPRANRDGNDSGGIALPDVAVPLGTFTGWNYQLPLLPSLGCLSGLVGSFIPFPLTAEERKTSGDARLSIAERYSGRNDYIEKVRISVQTLVSQRLLRAEDVNAVVEENVARWDYLTFPRR